MRFDVKNKNLLISYLCPKTCRDHNAHHYSIFLHEKLTIVSLARSTVLLIPLICAFDHSSLFSWCSQSPLPQVSTCKLSLFRKYSNNYTFYGQNICTVSTLIQKMSSLFVNTVAATKSVLKTGIPSEQVKIRKNQSFVNLLMCGLYCIQCVILTVSLQI